MPDQKDDVRLNLSLAMRDGEWYATADLGVLGVKGGVTEEFPVGARNAVRGAIEYLLDWHLMGRDDHCPASPETLALFPRLIVALVGGDPSVTLDAYMLTEQAIQRHAVDLSTSADASRRARAHLYPNAVEWVSGILERDGSEVCRIMPDGSFAPSGLIFRPAEAQGAVLHLVDRIVDGLQIDQPRSPRLLVGTPLWTRSLRGSRTLPRSRSSPRVVPSAITRMTTWSAGSRRVRIALIAGARSTEVPDMLRIVLLAVCALAQGYAGAVLVHQGLEEFDGVAGMILCGLGLGLILMTGVLAVLIVEGIHA